MADKVDQRFKRFEQLAADTRRKNEPLKIGDSVTIGSGFWLGRRGKIVGRPRRHGGDDRWRVKVEADSTVVFIEQCKLLRVRP
jgi:hypothetical protein